MFTSTSITPGDARRRPHLAAAICQAAALTTSVFLAAVFLSGCTVSRPAERSSSRDSNPQVSTPQASTPQASTPQASEPEPDGPKRNFVAVGPGAATEFEGADTYQPIPFVVTRLDFDSVRLETEGLGGRLDVWPSRDKARIDFGPAFEVRLPRSDTGSESIDRLGSIGTALELGAYVGLTVDDCLQDGDSWRTLASFTQDVTGTHEGAVVELATSYAWVPSRRWRLQVGASVSAANSRFMDTYFGVPATRAAESGLASFDPGHGLRSAGGSVGVLHSFSPTFGVFTYLDYQRLLGDAGDSPLVTEAGSPDQFLFGVAASFRF